MTNEIPEATSIGAPYGEENHFSPSDSPLDDAPCGYVAFTDDGILVAVNRTLLATLGFGENDLRGRSIETILPIGSRIFYQTHFFPLVRLHGHAEEIFFLLRSATGEDMAFLTNAVRRQRHGVWLTECIFMRVIERRKFEDALLRAKRDAEDARASSEASRVELEHANQLLEQQAVELESNQDHLQDQADELEAQSEELRRLNQDLLDRSTELERLRLVADDANRAKSSFLAVMSHELRTPLNAIGGYVQLLEMEIQGPITEAQADALARVSRSQRHLLRLINDILNLARVEAGRLDYEMQEFRMRDLVDGVLPMIEPQLAARNLRLTESVAEGLVVFADREKTEQIIINLLSNAVKFTDPGGSISIDARGGPSTTDSVHVAVADTGVGIPQNRLGQMFEPFAQMDTSHTRRSEGTGLGLTISRDLARGMGGDISVESALGAGSTFTLTLRSRGGATTAS